MKNTKSPSPASKHKSKRELGNNLTDGKNSKNFRLDGLDDILSEFNQASTQRVQKPKKKVRVKKKRSWFYLKKQKKPPQAKCANTELKIIGGSVKTGVIDCSGCKFSANLKDPECRFYCVGFAGKKSFDKLVLDNGYYKHEYRQEDVDKLKELYAIGQGLQVEFPEECGQCAKEHKKQLKKVRDSILRDPFKLLNCGVEIKENPDMTISGVEEKLCTACEKKVADSVEKTILKLKKSPFSKSYDFAPLVRPFFSNSRILFDVPNKNSIELAYDVGGSKVVLSQGDEEVYSLFPPEYFFQKEKLQILKKTYQNIVKSGSIDEGLLAGFCRDDLRKNASKEGYFFSGAEFEQMSASLLRCMAGLDVIELLLRDEKLQDVYINSPIDSRPLYVKHEDYDDCRTNIYLDEETARNIISKFRLSSGRSFSEVSPILDMELPEFGVRVNITGPPISPDGLAFAFRRASDDPWTLLRFIENKMISPLAAGLLSLMVSEESTILVCGDRGSGKTSLLTAMISAMPTKYRILSMEDTFEIPVPTLAAKGGFRIQRMRIKPSTSSSSFEKSAEEAMRSLLRMGDSAIIMGEVRGAEAKTLYEAMAVGGSGNCVMGTIHAKSAQSLLERVVFSLNVPKQSFKATDLVVMVDRIRPNGGSHRLRRVVEISEVKKDWDEPVSDNVFTTLMEYDKNLDLVVAGDALKAPDKSAVISKIAKKRGVCTEEIIEDIKTRAEIFEHIVSLYDCLGDRKILSMETIVSLNHKYAKLVDESISLVGFVDYKTVSERARAWADEKFKKKLDIRSKNGLPKSVQISTRNMGI